MAADSIARYVQNLSTCIDKGAVRRVLTAGAKTGQQEAKRAVAADLGDQSMSGWRRGKPINLETKASFSSQANTVTIHRTRESAGPWRVAEEGRNQGNASGFSGPGINRRTGLTARTKSGAVRKVRAVKARRWNGTTRGKDTWSDARALMDKSVPKAMWDQQIAELKRVIRG